MRFRPLDRITKKRSANSHYWVGVRYEKQHLDKEAETEYLKAVELDPTSYKAYCNIGSICSRQKDRLDEAFTYIKKALEVNPSDSLAIHNLVYLSYMVYEENKAIECLSDAIVTNPYIENGIYKMIPAVSCSAHEDIQNVRKLVDTKLRKIYLGNTQ